MASVIQQEILLVTGTSLSKQQLSNEQLLFGGQWESACRNGLLYRFLPEIIKRSAGGRRLALREVKHKDGLLEILLGESAQEEAICYSLNAHAIRYMCYN